MRLVSGNDLADGRVIWWTGSGWSAAIGDAVDAGAEAEAIAAREEAALRVNAPLIVEAEAGADSPRPAHIKDRVRAIGPSVRLDLSLRPADAAANEWIA